MSTEYLRAISVNDAVRARLSELPFSPTHTRRVCLHANPQAPLHTMLVESEAGSEYPPHVHLDGDEMIVAIEGRMEVVAWPGGPDCDPVRMILGLDSAAAYLPAKTIHLTRPLAGSCVYLEVKLGPFNKDATVVFR